MTRDRLVAIALCVAALPALAACDQEEMRDQPKYEAYEAAPGLPGGVSALQPPEGTVPRDALLEPRPPQPRTTRAVLARGRTMFNAICAPCHGRVGDGRGIVVQRGFPPPPSYHTERLRNAADRHFYDVITDGYGLMYSYANRVKPRDRWAVAAYIRALQLSQHAEVSDLPERLRRAVESDGEAGE